MNIEIKKIEGLTVGLGVAFILYGIYLFTGYIESANAFITGLSLAGFGLITIDFLEFAAEKNLLKLGILKGEPLNIINPILYFFVGCSMTVIPDILYMNFSVSTLERLNNSSSTIALGYTIVLIGLKNRYALTEELESMARVMISHTVKEIKKEILMDKDKLNDLPNFSEFMESKNINKLKK